MTELSLQALWSFLSAWWFSQDVDNRAVLLTGAGLSAVVTLCLWVMRQTRKERKAEALDPRTVYGNDRTRLRDPKEWVAACRSSESTLIDHTKCRQERAPWQIGAGLVCLVSGLVSMAFATCGFFDRGSLWPPAWDPWLLGCGAVLAVSGIMTCALCSGMDGRPPKSKRPRIRKPGDRDNVGQLHPDNLGKRCETCVGWSDRVGQNLFCRTTDGMVGQDWSCGAWAPRGTRALPPARNICPPPKMVPPKGCENCVAWQRDGAHGYGQCETHKRLIGINGKCTEYEVRIGALTDAVAKASGIPREFLNRPKINMPCMGVATEDATKALVSALGAYPPKDSITNRHLVDFVPMISAWIADIERNGYVKDHASHLAAMLRGIRREILLLEERGAKGGTGQSDGRNALANSRGLYDPSNGEYQICEILSLVEEAKREALEARLQGLKDCDGRESEWTE